MGDFNHGNIRGDILQSTGVEDQKLFCLVPDNFLTQHVLEPTRATRILDKVLSSCLLASVACIAGRVASRTSDLQDVLSCVAGTASHRDIWVLSSHK